MAYADDTAYQAALKYTYTSDVLEKQTLDDDEVLALLEKRKPVHMVGKKALTEIRTQNSAGYSAMPTGGGTLNVAGNSEAAEAQWDLAHHYMQIKVESATVERTGSNALAVANVVDSEVESATTGLRNQLTRQLFGNGDSLITACGTTTAANDIVLNVADGYGALIRGGLEIGASVDIGTAANEVLRAADRVITAYDDSATAPTITVNGGVVTTDANDYISIANARSGTTSYETNGFQNLIGTSTLAGINPATERVWKAANRDTTAQDLSLTGMLTQVRKVTQRSKTAAKKLTVISSLDQEQKFYELLQTQARFAGDAIDVGNSDEVKWKRQKMLFTAACPAKLMIFAALDDFFLLRNREPHWQNDSSGKGVLEWNQGTTAYVGALIYRNNFGVTRRNSSAILTNLNV